MLASSMTSFTEDIRDPGDNPFDFSPYMDQVSSILFVSWCVKCLKQAPLTIQSNSPLELLHQFFAKLGARYVVVTDTEGLCKLLYFL